MNIEDVINHFGTQVAAAKKIGCSQPCLANWKARGTIPPLQQLLIQRLTRGKLKADPAILKPSLGRTQRKARTAVDEASTSGAESQ